MPTIKIQSIKDLYTYVSPEVDPTKKSMVKTECFEINLPDYSFDEWLKREIYKLEEEGYEPDTLMMWEPVYSYYNKEISNLDSYVKESYDLDVIVIGYDCREFDWLKKLGLYVFENHNFKN